VPFGMSKEVAIACSKRHTECAYYVIEALLIYHPLITPIGRMRATFADSPALWTTSTTSSTFL
jgi:hypothetical protein